LDKNLTDYKNEMLKTWEELPPLFVTSASTKSGRNEILGFIENVLTDK
jgi:GTP-binding protein